MVVLSYWSSPQKAVVTTVRSPEYPKVGYPPPKENTFFLWGCGGNPVKCGRGSGLLNFKSIFGSLVVNQTLARKPMSAAANVAQVAEGAHVAQVVDDHAGTPLAGLSRQLKAGEVGELGLESRDIDEEIDVGRYVHRALKAVEAVDAKARNLKEAGVCLYVAAANLNRKAAKHPFKDAKAKQDLADALEDLDEKTKVLADMYAACGADDAEALAAEADLSEAAAEARALEAAVRVQLKERLDAIVEALRGRWGTEAAHDGLRSFLIEGTKSKIAALAEEAGVTELGTVRLYRGKTMTIGASFVVPRGFATNGSVGANMFLFEKVSDSVGGARWVALTGSAVNKNDLKTIMWYRLAKKAVNERADIKESIRALLLKALEGPASGASGAGGAARQSPWPAVLSAGDFTLDVFIHERKSSTAGLVMYQLALVPAAESMTAELAETMAKIKTNMTNGTSAARYFTMWERKSSGISLAVLAAAPAVKRKASESCEDRKGSKATRGAGPFYLGDEDYGAAAARLSAAGSRAGGREATVAEEP